MPEDADKVAAQIAGAAELFKQLGEGHDSATYLAFGELFKKIAQCHDELPGSVVLDALTVAKLAAIEEGSAR